MLMPLPTVQESFSKLLSIADSVGESSPAAERCENLKLGTAWNRRIGVSQPLHSRDPILSQRI